MEQNVVAGADGILRCPWVAGQNDLYVEYHDVEWGRPVHDNDALFERIALETFQSGLSWATILNKRDNFRTAFADFRIEAVARFDEADVERLLSDASIVRNRAKIEATIANARVAAALPQDLDSVLWSFAPTKPRRNPKTVADIPATSPESHAMAKELKRLGFRFVGPTTSYATMQAIGMVNDHLEKCHVINR